MLQSAIDAHSGGRAVFLVHIMIQMLVNRGVGQQVLTSGFVGVRVVGVKWGSGQNRVGEKTEQFSYSPTIVDNPVCTFFDSVLENVLERN